MIMTVLVIYSLKTKGIGAIFLFLRHLCSQKRNQRKNEIQRLQKSLQEERKAKENALDKYG